MTFLPIVERELRVAARRGATYLGRLSVPLTAMVISAWITLTTGHYQPMALLGPLLFNILAGFAFIYSIGAGGQITADCLSSEKRDGTLGLLFLTDLKGYDVVMGKLAATSLNAFYGLLGVMPVLAIPLLLGGVTAGQFWRLGLTLVNTLLFSLSAGMLASAMSWHARKAASGTFLLILLPAAGLPLAGVLWAAYHGLKEIPLPFLVPSAGYTFSHMYAAASAREALAFWLSLLTVHLECWLCLGLASRIVRRAWQDHPDTASKVRWKERWQQWCYGQRAAREAFRTRLLELNPVCWLAGRDRLKPACAWFCLGLIAAGWVWGAFKFGRDWLEGAALPTAIIMHCVLKLWIAGESGHRFAADLHQGALELLLSTPLRVEEILRGQLLALRRLFAGPVLALLCLDLLLMLGWLHSLNVNARERNQIVLIFLAGMTMLVADLFTLAWVGMWQGLAAKKATQASSNTAVLVLVLPWCLFGLCMTAWSLLDWRLGWRNGPTFGVSLGLWLVLGIGVDASLYAWSRSWLLTEFRRVAMRRFGVGPAAHPLWRVLGRAYGRWRNRGANL